MCWDQVSFFAAETWTELADESGRKFSFETNHSLSVLANFRPELWNLDFNKNEITWTFRRRSFFCRAPKSFLSTEPVAVKRLFNSIFTIYEGFLFFFVVLHFNSSKIGKWGHIHYLEINRDEAKRFSALERKP